MGEHGATQVIDTPGPRRRPRDVRSFWRWTLALVAPVAFLALSASIWLLPFDVRADLPAQAIKYVRRIEELIRCPVALVSTSPQRDDTILVRDPFAG